MLQNNMTDLSYVGSYISEIRTLTPLFESLLFSFICKHGNRVAHSLETKGVERANPILFDMDYPDYLLDFIMYDIIEAA